MALSHLSFIGQRLRTARENAKMTQRQAADALNTDDTRISGYENGRKGMSLKMIFKLAELYNVPPAFFFPKQRIPETPSSDDLLLDTIILKVESLSPFYLDLLNEVIAAFESHDTNKGVGAFRSLLDDLDVSETDKKA